MDIRNFLNIPTIDTISRNLNESQKSMIRAVSEGRSVKAIAVAGAGKTSTVIKMAEFMRKSKCLMLTYNASLKDEVRKKAKQSKLDNLEVHSYHSLAVKYYYYKAYTDDEIQKILKDNAPTQKDAKFDIVIIDEIQDMSIDYYRLVRKFLSDNEIGTNPVMVFLGDPYQCVYGFKNADPRYLTHGDQIFPHKGPIEEVKMEISYRVTRSIAYFVNDVMRSNTKIVAVKDGPPVKYVYVDKTEPVSTAKHICEEICTMISTKQYTYDDFFILVPTLNGDRIWHTVANMLTDRGIPVYRPNRETKGSESVRRGKIVFDTFHSSKGCERKVVIVFNFDVTYFRWYGTDNDPKVCPNTLYVAATRAKERLIVVHGADGYKKSQFKPLPFLDLDALHRDTKHIEIVGSCDIPEKMIDVPKRGDNTHKSSVTDMVGFVRPEFFGELRELVASAFIKVSEPIMDLPSPSEIDNEEVSDITGTAVATSVQKRHHGNISDLTNYVRNLLSSQQCGSSLHKKGTEWLNENPDTMEFIIKMCALKCSLESRFSFKAVQLTGFGWIDDAICDNTYKIVEPYLSENSSFEYPINDVVPIPKDICVGLGHKYQLILTGLVDIHNKLTRESIELKYTKELTQEHFWQVACYAWFMVDEKKDLKENLYPSVYRLINMRTGETWEIDVVKNYEKIKNIVYILCRNRWMKPSEVSETEFVSTHLEHTFIPPNTEIVSDFDEELDEFDSGSDVEFDDM